MWQKINKWQIPGNRRSHRFPTPDFIYNKHISLLSYCQIYKKLKLYRSFVQVISYDGSNVIVIRRLVNEDLSETILNAFRKISLTNVSGRIHGRKKSTNKFPVLFQIIKQTS